VATSQQEARWVLRAQCDDREAVEHLLRSIQDSLRRYIAGVVGPSDADDVLQDVLVNRVPQTQVLAYTGTVSAVGIQNRKQTSVPAP
jgi:hypothetical protein